MTDTKHQSSIEMTTNPMKLNSLLQLFKEAKTTISPTTLQLDKTVVLQEMGWHLLFYLFGPLLSPLLMSPMGICWLQRHAFLPNFKKSLLANFMWISEMFLHLFFLSVLLHLILPPPTASLDHCPRISPVLDLGLPFVGIFLRCVVVASKYGYMNPTLRNNGRPNSLSSYMGGTLLIGWGGIAFRRQALLEEVDRCFRDDGGDQLQATLVLGSGELRVQKVLYRDIVKSFVLGQAADKNPIHYGLMFSNLFVFCYLIMVIAAKHSLNSLQVSELCVQQQPRHLLLTITAMLAGIISFASFAMFGGVLYIDMDRRLFLLREMLTLIDRLRISTGRDVLAWMKARRIVTSMAQDKLKRMGVYVSLAVVVGGVVAGWLVVLVLAGPTLAEACKSNRNNATHHANGSNIDTTACNLGGPPTEFYPTLVCGVLLQLIILLGVRQGAKANRMCIHHGVAWGKIRSQVVGLMSDQDGKTDEGDGEHNSSEIESKREGRLTMDPKRLNSIHAAILSVMSELSFVNSKVELRLANVPLDFPLVHSIIGFITTQLFFAFGVAGGGLGVGGDGGGGGAMPMTL